MVISRQVEFNSVHAQLAGRSKGTAVDRSKSEKLTGRLGIAYQCARRSRPSYIHLWLQRGRKGKRLSFESTFETCEL